MKSCYVVHTKTIVLGDKLFDNKIIYKGGFESFFQNTSCLTQYVNEIKLRKCPNIEGMGYVYLDKNKIDDDPPYRKQGCSLYVKNKYSEDERLNYFYFELYKSVNLIAYRDGVKAKGKIFVHLYPFGCISIILALSLKDIKSLDEDELQKIITNTNPNKSHQSWTWRTKWGEMSLRETISLVENNIKRSIFSLNSNKFINFNSDWHTAYSFTRINYQRTDSFNEVNDNYIYVKNKLIDETERSMFSLDSTDSRQHQLRTFWRIARMQELVLIKKSLYTVYISNFKYEILKIRKQRLGGLKDRFSDDFWKKITVYNNDISEFIIYIDDIILNSSRRYRYYYTLISDLYCLDKQRERLISSQKEWIHECEQFKNPIIKTLVSVLPFVPTNK